MGARRCGCEARPGCEDAGAGGNVSGVRAFYRDYLKGVADVKLLPTALPLLAVLILAACGTVEGAGQDLTRAGVAIQQEARSASE
jgi:entericidin B